MDITLTDELKMETSLPTVRQKSLDQTHISHEANAMFTDLMSRAKSVARFLDISTTTELAGGVKMNQRRENETDTLFRFCMII